MKKVLYFCSAYPYPIDDGIKKINVNLINEFISKGYGVSLVVPENKEGYREFEEKVEIITYKKKRTMLKVMKDFFLLRPLYFSLYFDKDLLDKLNKEDCDIVFYDFYPLTQYSSNLNSEIFMMPDSMKDLAYSGFKNESNLVRKTYLLINFVLAYFYNKRIENIKKLYVSNNDLDIDNLENSYFFKIPADSYNFSKYHSYKMNEDEILFRGVMSFEPNITAVNSFYDEIFIFLIEKYPNLKLKIVGKNPSESLKNKLKKNCEITGFVDDIFGEMSKSYIHIVPMTSGTGVKTKMLDSIALKRLVFATPKSLNGIFESIEEAKNNGIIVYQNKEEFFENFDRLIFKEYNYEDMVNKAYSYLMKNTYAHKVDELFSLTREKN